MPILRRYLTTLDCVLTDAELLKYGRELSSVISALATEQANQASIKKEMASKIAGLEAKASEISAKVNRGKELREVQIEVVANFTTGMATEVRTDTGEIYRERPLRDEEKQQRLPEPKPTVSVEETDKVVEDMRLRKADGALD